MSRPFVYVSAHWAAILAAVAVAVIFACIHFHVERYILCCVIFLPAFSQLVAPCFSKFPFSFWHENSIEKVFSNLFSCSKKNSDRAHFQVHVSVFGVSVSMQQKFTCFPCFRFSFVAHTSHTSHQATPRFSLTTHAIRRPTPSVSIRFPAPGPGTWRSPSPRACPAPTTSTTHVRPFGRFSDDVIWSETVSQRNMFSFPRVFRRFFTMLKTYDLWFV